MRQPANIVEDPARGLWRQWLGRPKSTWIRKFVFQLHLWSGILLGLYVVVVCASGSAIVFRNDIYDWLESGGKAVSYKGFLYHWLSWLGKLHGSLLMDSAGMTPLYVSPGSSSGGLVLPVGAGPSQYMQMQAGNDSFSICIAQWVFGLSPSS
jgi:hypothetical protein